MQVKTYNLLKALIVILVTAKVCFYLFFPYPTIDGPWALSHTFSVVNGHLLESRFAHSYMGMFNLPPMYGFVTAFLYYPFTKTGIMEYSIFFWNIIFIVLVLWLAYKYLKKKECAENVYFLFAFCFLFSTYTYGLRPELLNTVIFVAMLFVLQNTGRYNFIWAGLLVAFAGLVHPVAGFYGCFFIAVYCYVHKVKVTKLLLVYLSTGFFLALLYGPIILKDVALWKLNFFGRGFENDTRHVSILHLIKYFSLTPLFLPVLVINILTLPRHKRIEEIIVWILCFAVFFPFMRSYYFPYLMHFLLWRLSLNNNLVISRPGAAVVYVTAFAGFLLVFVLPFVQVIESNIYVKQFKKNMHYIDAAFEKDKSSQIYIPSYYAMKVIFHDNSRLFVPSLNHLSGSKIKLDSSTFFLLDKRKDLEAVNLFDIASSDSVVVKEIYPPVKGLRRIALHESRSDSLGLWEVTFVRRQEIR